MPDNPVLFFIVIAIALLIYRHLENLRYQREQRLEEQEKRFVERGI